MTRSANPPHPALPKGFACGACGTEHVFPAYVYGHWDTRLIFCCPGPEGAGCGREYAVLRGVVTPEPSAA